MAQKRYNNKKKGANNDVIGIVLIIVSAFFLLCIIIPKIIGFISELIKGFTVGTLGFMAYPLFLSMFLLGIALLQKRILRIEPKYVAGIGVITFFAVMILQLATSQQYLSGGFNSYITAVYNNFTAGGALFGVFVFGIFSAIKIVFSYIVYVICIALTVLLILKDKLNYSKAAKNDKQYVEKERQFRKGNAPQQVKPIADTSLFVDTIRPVNNKFQSQNGSFSALSPKQNTQNNMQKYSSAPDIKGDEGFIPYDEKKLDKKTKAYNFFNEIKNAPFQPLTSSHISAQSSRSVQPAQNILPTVASSMPDIKNEQPEPQAKKPPKILHIEDIPGLKAVAMPPPKDISSSVVDGLIINGEELTKKLQEERAPLGVDNISKRADANPKRSMSISDFDTRKAEPKLAEPKKEYNLIQKQDVVEQNFQEVQQNFQNNQKPILNGDYFNKPQSKPVFPANPVKPAEPVVPLFENTLKNESILKNDNSQAYSPLHYDNYDAETEEEEADEISEEANTLENFLSSDNEEPLDFDSKFDNFFAKSKADLAPSYSENSEDDDEPVLDLSEKGFENDDDQTGYYNVVEDTSYKKPSDFSKNESRQPLTPFAKLKPENQIKLDDYAKNLTAKDAPKVKKPMTKYNAPPLDLLLNSKTNSTEDTENDSNEKARLLEETLRGLKLPATVSAITRGPSVTRYELEMPPGIPVKRIEQFAKDIEYNLASNGKIRIETPIPGKRAVGIEVPNEIVDIVGLKEIIGSKEFVNSSSPISLALGKDIAGANIVCSLDKMPHLLIAGATGSGKSACLNSIIISILYKSSPDDVRIILIDPKHVEFTIYRDMPHLLTNEIITDSQQALNAFKWTKQEMDRRYILFSQHVVRNLGEYNKLDIVKNGGAEKLPNIVLIVDELAELMMSNNRKDLEDKIMSMAQKARAAGIHLILATQRPSVDVITGTIKANLPSRIAFAVKSLIDSRTILDQSGAETLLGKGDMLYAPLGVDDPRRVQGAYVTNEEVATIVDYVRQNNSSDFDDGFMSSLVEKAEATETDASPEEESEFDPLMKDVLKLIIATGTASTTFIQRRFAVGYARASRIMDQMEINKFIGPLEGSKPRAIYITQDQFKEMFGEE